MFHVTVTNPLGPAALVRAGTRAGHAIEEIEEAVRANDTISSMVAYATLTSN